MFCHSVNQKTKTRKKLQNWKLNQGCWNTIFYCCCVFFPLWRTGNFKVVLNLNEIFRSLGPQTEFQLRNEKSKRTKNHTHVLAYWKQIRTERNAISANRWLFVERVDSPKIGVFVYEGEINIYAYAYAPVIFLMSCYLSITNIVICF